MKKVLKTITGIFCGIGTAVYLFLAFTEDQTTVFVVLAIIFGFLTFLCFRKKKLHPKVEQTEPIQEVQQINVAIRTEEAASMDAVRIISESYQIMQNTKDIATLCSRYELGLQKCNHLKYLETAGKFHGNSTADQWISTYTQTYYQLIKNCHDRFLAEVNTATGKKNRSEKFWAELAEQVDEFTLNDLHELIR